MGNRRLSRKRLYQVEKLGKNVKGDIGTGAGFADAIKSATQHRQGSEIITEIAIDLDGGTMNEGGGARKVVGVNGTASEIAELTVANFGHITEVRAVVVEDIASNGSIDDLDLEYAAASAVGGATMSTAVILTALTDTGVDKSTAYDANDLAGKFLFLVDGEGGGNTAKIFSAGKILIYIHGFVAPDDI